MASSNSQNESCGSASSNTEACPLPSLSQNEDKINETSKYSTQRNDHSKPANHSHRHYANSYTSKKYNRGEYNRNYNTYKHKNSNFNPSAETYHNRTTKNSNNYFYPRNKTQSRHYNKSREQNDQDHCENLNKDDNEVVNEKDKNNASTSLKENEEKSHCELNNNDTENAMGNVVNGRYMRNSSNNPHFVIPKVPSANRSNFRSYSSKTMSSGNDSQRYGGKSFKSFYKYNPNIANQFETQKLSNYNNRTTDYHYKGPYQNDQYDNQNQRNFYSNNDTRTPKANFNNSKEDANNLKLKNEISPTITKENITQRDRLIQQLEKRECECMVCCELIRIRDQVWNCSSCYHLFHLRCIKKWARSPTAIVPDCGWRCPACQNISEKVPYHYYCFCGKSKEPEVNHHYLPHSCGEVCGKQRDDKNCNHRCNILCHPGPCPPCSATANRSCACGKTQKMMLCNQDATFTCTLICGKLLNCECHTCPDPCHTGDCKPCTLNLKQKCFCGKNEREVLCDISTAGVREYCCNMICNKKLSCNFHECSAICHKDLCTSCKLLPSVVTSCPCGKSLLKELYALGKAKERVSCNDPVPVCEAKCEKALMCGPKDNSHKCNVTCHIGECPLCPLKTNIKCQCNSTSKEFSCCEIPMASSFQCEKRCNRRKDCGRHKCLNVCCIYTEHKCDLICNKKLTCGSHQCPEVCHAGKCPVCWNVSFDELRCHCGQSVLYPPIHCGTKPPECTQPCVRIHPCSHDVTHSCHSEPECPPCTVFTTKWCFGKHERHSHIPCFLDGISCGKLCNKPLSCGRHKCREICHTGPCLKENAQCVQSCEQKRACGHPCAAPCHDGECPNTLCKAEINVSCPCGHRTEIATCSEDNNSYRLMSVSLLATKMQDIKAGESVNIGDLLSKKNKSNRLQCNEECAVLERNKRLALALQIQNPELSCKPGPPSYSNFLKDETKKNPKFVSSIYDKFTELVQLAKQSKQKSRSHAFPPMNRDHRRIVHEMAEFFGCETQSYDEEPVKNVVITAFRNKSWLPFISLLAVVQREKEREMGLRKGPSPLISQNVTKTSDQSVAVTSEKKEKTIDYFDFPG